MTHGHALGQCHARVLFGLVSHHHGFDSALGAHRLRDLRYRMTLGPLAHLLPARHGHGVVVQNFVGDVHAGGNALAHGQHAAVKVSAVTQVGKNVRVRGEGLLADPGHALAAHLCETHGAAVHPQRHVMAAYTGHGARALRHAGRSVVRAARAKPGRALGVDLEHLHGPLFGLDQGQPCGDARAHVAGQVELLNARGNRLGYQRGRQVGVGAQQRVSRRVGHAPLAATEVALDLVELAQDDRPYIGAPVVQLFLELVFNDLAFFFHHQNLLQTGSKFARELRLERPHHADLVQPDADLPASVVVQPQIDQRLARVVVGLAAGDQAEAVVRTFDRVVVQAVGAYVSQRCVPLEVKQALLLLQRAVGPANVHAARRHFKVGRQFDLYALRVNQRAGRRLHNFLNRLHARPHAGIAAHGQRVQAQVQNLLHAGRKKHRQAAGLEDVVALVCSGRALGHVVVTGHRQRAAPGRGTGHVGMLEHVRGAVHARSLAVPDAEHAVVLVGARRRKAQLLRAPDGGRRQLLVDARLKHDVLRLQVLGRLPQRLVITPQWRAAVARNKAGGVFALLRVAQALQHGQLDQRLHAAHEGIAVVQAVLVVQCDGLQRLADVLWQRGVHGDISRYV